jgi:hypothetical protein
VREHGPNPLAELGVIFDVGRRILEVKDEVGGRAEGFAERFPEDRPEGLANLRLGSHAAAAFRMLIRSR